MPITGMPVNNFNLPPLQYEKQYITQAQCFTLFTTPIVLLSGLPDFYISVERLQIYREVGLAYAGGIGLFQLRLNATVIFQFAAAQTLASATAYSTIAMYPAFNTADVTANINTNFDVKLQTADPTPASGTNGIWVTMYYRLIPAALPAF